MVLYGFVALTLAAMATRNAAVLTLLYPATALVTGALLYFRNPPLYLAFGWWIWLLTPEVRRIAQFYSGWSDKDPIMLAPFLVSALCGFTVLRCLGVMRFRLGFGFALVMAGIGYAALVGAARHGPMPAAFGLLNWVVPMVLGFHAMVSWPRYPEIRDVTCRTFLYGVIVIGGYGLYQYFVMPAWDAYWMVNVGMTNQGLPYPREVRVFSTLNSSGPFAFVLMCGLMVLFAVRGSPLLPLAAAMGYASLFLSLVRAAWLGWLFALVVLVVSVSNQARMRLTVVAVVIVAAVIPTVAIDSVHEVVSKRFDSLFELQHDQSYIERQDFYSSFLNVALTEMVGQGIGATGVATKLSSGVAPSRYANFDSGFMQIPFVLGWPGAFCYVLGSALLLARLVRAPPRDDMFAGVSRAIVVSLFACMIFDNTMIGVTGAAFWYFLGMGLAGIQYREATDQVMRYVVPLPSHAADPDPAPPNQVHG
jgi:hypothetical protein